MLMHPSHPPLPPPPRVQLVSMKSQTVDHSRQHVWRVTCSLHFKKNISRFRKSVRALYIATTKELHCSSLHNLPYPLLWQSEVVDPVTDYPIGIFIYFSCEFVSPPWGQFISNFRGCPNTLVSSTNKKVTLNTYSYI